MTGSEDRLRNTFLEKKNKCLHFSKQMYSFSVGVQYCMGTLDIGL